MDSDSKASNRSRRLNPNIRMHLHRSKSYSHMDFECLNIMYNDNHLCDVVLIAEGQEVHAHKLILASCSAFFYFKFSKDRHLRAMAMNRVEIPNMSYETLSSVISYLYKSEIVITEDNSGDLLAAAYLFAMKDLQAACLHFLAANLNPKNCIGTRDVASLYQCENLVSIANYFMITNFSEIVQQDEFLEMSYDQVSDLIGKDVLCISDEEEILKCVIKWVKKDLPQRKAHIYNLMEKIRFSLIPQIDIIRRLRAEEWLTSDSHFKVFLLEVLERHVIDASLECFPIQQRSSKCLIVVGATNEDVFKMEIYDLKKNIWFNVSEFPEIEFTGFTRLAIHDTRVYYSDGKTLKFLDVSDSAQPEWIECSSEFENIKWYSMIVFNNSLYVIGGYGEERLPSAKSFDLSTGVWENLPNMSEAKTEVGLGVLHQNLYSIGGFGGSSVSTVECYNPDSDTWCSMQSMSVRRSAAGITTLGDTLYAAGGMNQNVACKQVESFNPTETIWKKLPDMNHVRTAPGMAAFDGRLFVVGGKEGDTMLKSVEVFCPSTNTWTVLPSEMHTGKYFVSVAVVDRAKIRICKTLK